MGLYQVLKSGTHVRIRPLVRRSPSLADFKGGIGNPFRDLVLEPDLKCGFAEVPASTVGMAGRDWRGKLGAFVTALNPEAAKNSQKANFESGS